MKKMLLVALLVLTTLGICEEETYTYYYYVTCYNVEDMVQYFTPVKTETSEDRYSASRAAIAVQFGQDFKAFYGQDTYDKVFDHISVFDLKDEKEIKKMRKKSIADKITDGYKIIDFLDFEFIPNK